MTVKLFIASSLDGYIAGESDDLSWLFEAEGSGDNGYGAFFAGVDMVVMGKRTYDWIRQHEQNWPYAGKTSYVITHATSVSADDVKFETFEAFQSLLPQFSGNIWLVGGGEIIKLFLENGLIDKFQITLLPRLLGKGIRLFPEGNYTAKLDFTGSKQYGELIELDYRRKQRRQNDITKHD